MVNPSGWSNTQNKIYGQNSVSANGVVNIMSGTTTIKSYTSPKNVGYLYYASPNVDSTYTFSISSGSATSGNNGGNDNGNNNNNGNDNNGNDDDNDNDDDIEILSSKGNYMNIKMFLIMILGMLTLI